MLQVHQIGMTEEGLFDMGELHVLLRVIYHIQIAKQDF